MSDLNTKLQYTLSNKDKIKQAITDNGGDIDDSTPLSVYNEKINSIAGIKSAYIVQSTSPEDTRILWVDSTDGVLKYYNGSEWKPIFAVWGNNS